MKKPINTLSILIPAHNEALHIASLLRSLMQNMRSFNAIVVDDYSTDGTFEIGQEVTKHDERFTIARNPGVKGVCGALNHAYRLSSGSYLAMAGADDLVQRDYVEAILSAVAAFDGNDQRIALFYKLRTFSQQKRFDGMVIPRGQMGNRSGPTTVMSRALARIVFPIAPELSIEDAWTMFLSQHLADRIVELPEPIYNYRIHLGNSNPRHKSYLEYRRFMTRYERAFPLIRDLLFHELPPDSISEIDRLIDLSRLRESEQVLKLLTYSNASFLTRLRFSVGASPWLHRLRHAMYRDFSGWPST